MADLPEVMNIREASEYLGVSRGSLCKYALEKTIPAFKMGNRWKFKKATLDRWMEDTSSTAKKNKRRDLHSRE
jgi:excisionase family DNA binding protein